MIRRQIKTTIQENITTTIHKAFNWVIVQMIVPPTCSFITLAKKEIDRGVAPNLTFYVRGEATVTNSNKLHIDNRIAGMFSGNRPNHPAGVSKVTAITELELWCCNIKENNGSLPKLSPIILNIGDSLNKPINSKILICSGKLEGYKSGNSFIVSKNIFAEEKTYALLFA